MAEPDTGAKEQAAQREGQAEHTCDTTKDNDTPRAAPDRAELCDTHRHTVDTARKPSNAPDQAEQTQDGLDKHCDRYWDKLLHLWESSDALVGNLIAHMKQSPEEQFQVAGNDLRRVNEGWQTVSAENHECVNENCRLETGNLTRIIKKNMKILEPKKSIPEEEEEAPSQEQVQERADQEYCAWKDWKERHDKEEKEKVERLRKSKKKEDSWSLYRECTKILKENHTRWMERRADEERKKLEQEKQDRIEDAARKKAGILKKVGKQKIKKETKAECSRRMEKEKKLKGLQKMKSDLWKQRREKDERLRTSWTRIKEAAETAQIWTETSLEEEEGFDEWWGDEVTLTDEERNKLEELETWYTSHLDMTTNGETSPQEDKNQPLGRTSPQENQDQEANSRQPTTTSPTSPCPSKPLHP